VVSVASRGSERLVERLVKSRDEAVAAEMRATEATEKRGQAERAKARAEAADVAKSDFLASMSHELRTPLNAILGYTELVSEEIAPVAPESLRDLERIARASTHLRVLIDDVLDLSKVEAGRLELRVEPVELGPLFDELQKTAQPLVERRQNTLEIATTDLVVRADTTRVLQVLLNLVGNSAKFTEEGRIQVAAERVEGMVQIDVVDDGCGMTPEQLETAFQVFGMVERGSRPEGGTGLGLPLARRLAETMGGTLEAQSVPGRGTTMRVRLPA